MAATPCYVYLVRCADGSLYTGMCRDLKKCIDQHNQGTGAKNTRSRCPVHLVYYERHTSMRAARSREAILKKWPKLRREQLVRGVIGEVLRNAQHRPLDTASKGTGNRYNTAMEDHPKKRSDRYDVSGNVEAQYVDEAETVLVNKKGITELEALQVEEEEALARAYEALLSEVRVDTPITCELLLHIHARIFDDLYDWAGRWRTVWIRKPGVTWPAPDFLPSNMKAFEQNVLAKHPAGQLDDEDAFCRAVGEIQGEFLVIHPFREGNARTIKLATNLLAAQTERPLLKYDSSEDGKVAYITAAKRAFKQDYSLMTEIIRQALMRAQQ